MSEPIQNTPSPCDQALDYLYEMLDGEDKARFLAHLATCARCQAELESFGRVREVAQAALPKVEPTERLTGALHQQLMHEAAQRKPAGKLLPFVRRIVRHPAYAAAAGLLLVGGAVGLQWSRGKLFMPAAEPAMQAPATPAPVEAAPSAPAPPAAVAAAPGAPPAEKKVAPADEVASPTADRLVEKLAYKEARGKADLAKDEGGYDKRARLDAPAAEAPARKPKANDDLDGLVDGSLGGVSQGLGAKGGSGTSSSSRGPAQNSLGGFGAGAGRQAVAPSEPSRTQPAPSKSAPVAPAPSPATAAPSAAGDLSGNTRSAKKEVALRDVVSGKASTEEKREENQALEHESAAAAPAPKNLGDDSAPSQRRANAPEPEGGDAIDAERRRAGQLAQAGRCDEAASMYGALDRKVPDRLNAQDRLSYARCLRMLGRLDPAQGELDQLRANKQQQALPAAALNAEQNALDLQKQRTPASTGERRSASKAKKAVRAQDANEAPPKPAAPAKRAY